MRAVARRKNVLEIFDARDKNSEILKINHEKSTLLRNEKAT